ncbi:exodeoxyribonuclease V subunit alpha [Pajaroellobacter abortibovis]|uniref:Exodeoxyribonuclease V subunit alpha n=1 Tax=Pajaroellobacter abortibovis TaxID=1882918 RepID=A0A1L6MWP4_9BACT|nr:exodeoxyribonuclease V subunit alpha [Pajaroellobacter abortibovis]APR99956.1 exodeoxyribonuclease V subunit alpha [Pajaroellobacter abortibovis]
MDFSNRSCGNVSYASFGAGALQFLKRGGGERVRTDSAYEEIRTLLKSAPQRQWGEELLSIAWEIVESVEPPCSEIHKTPLGFLVLASLLSVRYGHTRLPFRGEGKATFQNIMEELGVPLCIQQQIMRWLEESHIPTELQSIIGHGGEAKPIVIERGALALHKLYRMEKVLAQWVQSHADSAQQQIDKNAMDAAVQDVYQRPPFWKKKPMWLSLEQKKAVEAAALSNVLLITGGPGTGKTSVVVSILRMLVRLGLSPHQMALVGPTGKAARCLDKSVRTSLEAIDSPSLEDRELLTEVPRAQTIHSLLRYVPSTDTFRHHSLSRLPYQLVCVDEASMVDVSLMVYLVQALCDTTRFILLGDVDQLPSVEPGAVFRDLLSIPSEKNQEKWCTARLTENFRIQSEERREEGILSISYQIRSGQVPSSFTSPSCFQSMDSPFSFEAIRRKDAELLEGEWTAMEDPFLKKWFQTHIEPASSLRKVIQTTYPFPMNGASMDMYPELRSLLLHYEKSRILGATYFVREGGGMDQINQKLHQHMLKFIQPYHLDYIGSFPFCPGEPVLLYQNDYTHGLRNGDQGIVLRIKQAEKEQELAVAFLSFQGCQEELLLFPLFLLADRLEHAYAMTVHKSQGSEFDHVALILPQAATPFLTRELIYTAITRSRTSVVILGQLSILHQGITRTTPRHTWLPHLLQTCMM